MRVFTACTFSMALTYCQLDYSNDSTELASRLAQLKDFVFLDSGQPLAEQGRFDLISACASHKLLVNHELDLMLQRADTPLSNTGIKLHDANCTSYIESFLSDPNDTPSALQQLCFTSGWIGQLDYELGEQQHKLTPKNSHANTLGQLNYYHWAIVVDHQQQQCFITCEHPKQQGQLSPSALIKLLPEAVQTCLKQANDKQVNDKQTPDTKSFELLQAFQSDSSKQQYQQAFKQIQDYILAGDCYQVNLTQRFSSAYQGDSWQAYLALRQIAPAPYSGFMRLQHKVIASCSPELFLHSHDQHITTKPIKGTIAKAETQTEDQANINTLLNSSKDHAENIMIVDLLRNDLSQLCLPFSVKTPKCCALESFSNVHHLVSQVEGQLPATSSPLALLLAAFPGGSITGAPKKRSMEIIQELENNHRNAYCGSLFSYSSNKQLNSNILIRSLEFHKQQVYCWGGGGITAASTQAAEYQESLTKIQRLLSGLEEAFLS